MRKQADSVADESPHFGDRVSGLERDEHIHTSDAFDNIERVLQQRSSQLNMTDPFGYDVQISGLANNALTDV